ncbi:MAG: VCBS repeat-containing protein [Verrucomicrobia bacterium]|nr:VCBS repeat-containing protein [Verrucomicrobiota bacterium]
MKTKTLFPCAGIFLATLMTGFSQPTFTKHPTNQSVSLGANVQFMSLATSTNPPLTYQWRLTATNLAAQTNASLSRTNVQLADAGDYDVVATDSSSSTTSHVAHLEVDPTFTKITTGSIVTEVGVGGGYGCAWGDYDNDGFIDLILTSPFRILSNTVRTNVLFHNAGDGTFTKITNSLIVSEARDWRGCAWADYDNDGDLDLFVTSTDANGFAAQNELFRNNGDGSFTKMTSSNVGAIVSTAAGGSEHCVWADYDNDGFLDMFVARFGPDWLFHNNADGTFAKMTNTAVGLVQDTRESYGAMWGDYDNDGRPDLFVAVKDDNGINQTNFLYYNQGNGTFTRIVAGSIATNNEYSVACAWSDYDNDGYLDLFVVNGKYHVATNSLYHNNGDGTFTKMTSNIVGSVASDAASFSSCAWADYDNDGFIDLFVTRGSGEDSPGPNFLYHNNGDGTFTRIYAGSPVNDLGVCWNCAWGDYDNDGFLDLFVTHPVLDFINNVPTPNLLYRNNGNSNGWLTVKLVGTASNRSAIGAKVRVQASIRGKMMWQIREINSGHGAGGASLFAHFGLGDATNIDLVRIEWPSGIVQTITNVAPKQSLTVVEHQQPGVVSTPSLSSVSLATNGAVNLSVTGDTNLLYLFEASTNLVNWTKVGVRSNATGIVGFTDIKATNYVNRFYRVSVP